MRKLYGWLLFGWLGVALLIPQNAHAGPWSKGLGGVYAKLGTSFFLANGFVDTAGNFQDNVTYFGATTSLYFEVGLFKGLQIQGSLPYLIANNTYKDGATFTQGSFGDGLLGLQYQLPIPGPFVLALVANVKLPMYDLNRLGRTERIGPTNALLFPAQGDGQVDLDFWVSFGGSIPGLPIYMFLDVGYRHRTEATFVDDTSPPASLQGRTFVDSLVFFGQFGWTVWPKQGMILQLNVQGTIPLAFEIDGVNEQFTKGLVNIGLGVYLPIYKSRAGTLALEFNFDPVVWSRNAAQGWSWALGLSFNR